MDSDCESEVSLPDYSDLTGLVEVTDADDESHDESPVSLPCTVSDAGSSGDEEEAPLPCCCCANRYVAYLETPDGCRFRDKIAGGSKADQDTCYWSFVF